MILTLLFVHLYYHSIIVSSVLSQNHLYYYNNILQHTTYNNMKVPQSQSQLLKLQYLMVHFKNSIHEGTFSHNTNRREGPGITILDNGSIIIGTFKQDQLSGMSLIYLTLDTYFIGQLNKGCLDGPFVIRTPNLTVYSTANINKIDGQILVLNYEQKSAQLWSVQADGSCQICKQMALDQYLYRGQLARQKLSKVHQNSKVTNLRTKYISIEPQVLRILAPYMQKMPDVTTFIKQYVSYNSKVGKIPNGSNQQHFTHKLYVTNQMLYLHDKRRDCEQFLGICLNRYQQIIAHGIFTQSSQKLNNEHRDTSKYTKLKSYECQYLLNGLGYLYLGDSDDPHSQHQVVYQGQFIKHRLHGAGSKQLLRAQKIIYGEFNHGDIRSMDIIMTSQLGNQNQQIKKLVEKNKKSIHIHSLKFLNNYANQRPILIMKNLLRIIVKNQNQSNQQIQ